MGCIFGKGFEREEDNEAQGGQSLRNFSRRGKDHDIEGEKKALSDVDRVHKTYGHQRNAIVDGCVNERNLRLRVSANRGEYGSRVASFPNSFVAEHVAAGWPAWLVTEAREAVIEWQPRKISSFQFYEQIGKGTYSVVFRALDLEKCKVVALKKVEFSDTDPGSISFMAREIHILRRLDHPNVVKLEGLIPSVTSRELYLIMEYMEHDLAGLLGNATIRFTEAQIKCYMKQLLCGLAHCHDRGVLHRDIKGSNLLIGNDGILRIADFGLSKFYSPGQRRPLTTRVVTLWYRAPELLLGATRYDASIDLWSAGCILAELFAGKPIMTGANEVEQLHNIFKLCGAPSEEYWRRANFPAATLIRPRHPCPCRLADRFRGFPPTALALIETLLAIDPADRGTAASALQSDFFTTMPLPSDPASLPKYPPSKEKDVKLRIYNERRKGAAAMEGQGCESRRASKESIAGVPVPDANAELQVPLQKRQVQAIPKSISVKYNRQGESGSGHSMELPRVSAVNHFLPPGKLVYSGTSSSSSNKRVCSELQPLPAQSSSTLRSSNSCLLRTQTSLAHQGGGAGLSNLADSATTRSSLNSRYKQLTSSEHHEKFSERQSSSHKREECMENMEPLMAYDERNSVWYSGPLMHPGENVEEMLKERDRIMQQAIRIRKAQLDKTKMN
ncbi:[RNA-polymerase]-subunit kinase protein [Dioscorea alata]|uniref:[RNA-polymerase]-subunit kinase protein n=3 Tax=Dioscorea alata TaxID=55571 RepID=A0ACB7W1B7_DIOAL|nr:[RNA-polymerase]-subunit kinase protein [Dioscorea alata]KAH7681384.1 [RNA-polymerase]-subunit kinase protein [Dioscorea alata]KAH7681385.1 [RNA-polymerase]-subunit kinase protein [Dioscorea alata]